MWALLMMLPDLIRIAKNFQIRSEQHVFIFQIKLQKGIREDHFFAQVGSRIDKIESRRLNSIFNLKIG